MSSRAATAASSRRVKQELVRLLFGREATSATSTNHACRSKILDHSIYSYADLRGAYLEKLQQYHPDKQYSAKDTNQDTYATRHSLFVELQEAWTLYDQQAKISRMVDKDYYNNGDGEGDYKNRNFTMFGVGCSFSDNDAERDLRNEIMDQAGRGWFSAGSLAPSSEASSSADATSNTNASNTSTKPSLLDDDDDMFVMATSDTEESKSKAQAENIRNALDQPTRRKKTSLVDSKFRPRSVIG